MCKFRLLTADEIECRVGQTKKDSQGNITGVSLLLYKDARCDMAILDETVGSMAWQRSHEFKDGKLYCTVSIFDKENNMWISKEDVGVESNTEAEKGQASDSFKRACVNWGIGRELYTAPFIWVTANSGENLKYTKFDVKEISYDDNKRIASLVIVDNNGTERFRFPNKRTSPKKKETKVAEMKSEIPAEAFDYIKAALDGCKEKNDLVAVANKYSSEIQSDHELMKAYQTKKTQLL